MCKQTNSHVCIHLHTDSQAEDKEIVILESKIFKKHDSAHVQQTHAHVCMHLLTGLQAEDKEIFILESKIFKRRLELREIRVRHT